MKYILFIFIALSSVFCNQMLEEIDSKNFGKSLLDTINLQLSSGQSVDDLLKVLDDMRDTMNSQKEQEEHEHQGFQAECGKDIDFYQQEIAQATVMVVDMQREIDQANEDLKIVESLLEQVYQQMKMYQEALTKLNDIRMQEAQAFKQEMDEHDITTTAIEESKRYFVQIRGEISFLQTRKNAMVQLSSHFHNAKNQVKSQKYRALFNILAQMSSKAPFDNAEVVAKILELCNRVLENVAESRLAEQEAENERIGIFTEKKKILDDNIFNTQKKIDNLESQKKAIEGHLNIVQNIFDDNCHRRDENTNLLKSRKAECDNEVVEYGLEREKDLEQIGIAEKIITLTETNLAVMKQYLGERRQASGVKVNMKI